MEARVEYFDKLGPENTETVFRIAGQRAKEMGIKTILVASTTGDTAVKAMDALKGFRLIAVGYSQGFDEPNTNRFTEENRKMVESKGGIVLTTTHAFAGVGRAMRTTYNNYMFNDIMALTLKIFGQGMKVVCEIAMMAADCGWVRTDEDVVSIAGTHRGADTAIVLKPVYTAEVLKMKVREILCKPHF